MGGQERKGFNSSWREVTQTLGTILGQEELRATERCHRGRDIWGPPAGQWQPALFGAQGYQRPEADEGLLFPPLSAVLTLCGPGPGWVSFLLVEGSGPRRRNYQRPSSPEMSQELSSAPHMLYPEQGSSNTSRVGVLPSCLQIGNGGSER